MADYDLVIRGARIVDGTGAAAFAGDVAIRADRIAAVGRVEGVGAAEIDGSGLVVAPGFVDIHTHYDPQLCWDGLATPSIEHGVTTVVIGNCSLSLAPVRPGQSGKLVRMFEKIEDIKQPTFDAAVPFAWESFGDYLDHIRPTLGINVGALVGHSALRWYVMGAASQERAATDEEIAAMCDLLAGAMADGALGMSISYVDIDENGRPVPSRFADMREKIALARTMVASGRGVLQTVPFFIDLERQLENIRELGDISLATGITCSLAPIVYSPLNPTAWSRSLAELEAQQARGAKVFGQSMPRTFDINIRLSETSFLLYALPTWNRFMALPLAERREAFADPANRARLVAEGAALVPLLVSTTVGQTYAPANAGFTGRTLTDIAAERGCTLPDVMLDLALADDLRTEFQIRGAIHADPETVATILDHPLIHIGGSDAGAHIAQFCGAGDTCYMLERFVREEGRMTLERAVYRMTGEAARAWGIADRGTLEVGRAADLVLFDAGTIARGPEIFVGDFPGGANRYVRHAEGIHTVIVNGQIVRTGGAYTEARAGRVV